jgi:hypothetical protein
MMIAVTGGFEGICALRLYIWTAALAARFWSGGKRRPDAGGGWPPPKKNDRTSNSLNMKIYRIAREV